MRRHQSGQNQLELEWTGVMRWDDVPADIRERVREHLGDLLRQATAPSRLAEGPTDE